MADKLDPCELPHNDLYFLQKIMFWSSGLKGLISMQISAVTSMVPNLRFDTSASAPARIWGQSDAG